MKTRLEAMKKSGLSLAVFALISVVLVATTNHFTLDKIKSNNAMMLLEALNEIIPADVYDNDLAASKVTLQPSKTGFTKPLSIYFAEKNKALINAVFEVTTIKGYSGNITILVGINTNDYSISSVRVVQHKETPGLGDKMEIEKSNWVVDFNGRSLNNPEPSRWHVKKDGGDFDQFTGATITPRAIVNLIKSTLLYAQDNLTMIYAKTKQSQ